jgi:hypothetical protein
MNHPVLPDGRTATTAKKVVGHLTELGYDINATQFMDSSSRLYQSLVRTTPLTAQIDGDMFTTRNHLGIILDLNLPQWTGDYSPSHPVIPEHLALDIVTESSVMTNKEAQQHISVKHNTVDVIPIHMPREIDMTIKKQAQAPTWFHVLNIVIGRPELMDHLDTYIRLLRQVIFEPLTEQQTNSLASRLIIAPSHFTFVGDPTRAHKLDRAVLNRGLVMKVKLDTSDEEHHLIQMKVLLHLMKEPHARTLSAELRGLPVFLATPIPHGPAKNVQAELVPAAISNLRQYWVILHGLPREYTPHHLLSLLTWTLDCKGIKHIFQARDSMNKKNFPATSRILPSYIIIVDRGLHVQELVAAKDLIKTLLQSEQRSPPATSEYDPFLADLDAPDWIPELFSIDSPNLHKDNGFPKVAHPRKATSMTPLSPLAGLPVITRQTLAAVRQGYVRPSPTAVLPAAPEENGLLPFPQPALIQAMDALSYHMLGIYEEQAPQVISAALSRLSAGYTRDDMTRAFLQHITDEYARGPTEPSLELKRHITEWSRMMVPQRVDNPTTPTRTTLGSPPNNDASPSESARSPPRPLQCIRQRLLSERGHRLARLAPTGKAHSSDFSSSSRIFTWRTQPDLRPWTRSNPINWSVPLPPRPDRSDQVHSSSDLHSNPLHNNHD